MNISNILLSSEANPYGASPLPFDSEGRDIFVVSDLHLASGLQADGNYNGTENFFADESLGRFLDSLRQKANGKKMILVINGDFIDFLRIRNIPVSDEDFEEWSLLLANMGIDKSVEELRASIVKKERIYGLKTHDYKSVWKLHHSAKGHPVVFKKLASWLEEGHWLVITKGNHDLEWYWQAVRNCLRYLLAKNIALNSSKNVAEILEGVVTPQVYFADNQLLIDKKILVEHGHRYQKVTAVQGPPLLENKVELNLPFGSFFNRYLLNRLEIAYPYLDNIRPSENILPVLLRERFPLAVQVLFKYIPFMLLIIPKKLYWEMFKRLFSFILIIIIPIVITIYAIWKGIHINLQGGQEPFWIKELLNLLKNSAYLFLSYIFGRLLVMVKLSGPESLSGNAEDIFKEYPEVQIVTFGHTHDPEQTKQKEQLYFNTGTWIPVYEISAADVRLDKTYTYLHISHDDEGKIIPQDLMRWNDDASRADPLVLTDKK